MLGRANIFGNATVGGSSQVYGNCNIYENASIDGHSEVYGNSDIHGVARINDKAKIGYYAGCGTKYLNQKVEICGDVLIDGHTEITENAIIKDRADYAVFKNNWSSGRYFTWTKSNDMWKVGCFYGTGKQLIEKAYSDSEESGRRYEAIVKYTETLNKQNT